MSGSQLPIRRPRPSASADAALAAELKRVSAMTIEERIKAALTMKDRFDWIQPAAGQRAPGEK